MSDHSLSIHHRRKITCVPGVNRNRKYSRIALGIFAVLLFGSAYLAISSGAFTDDSPGVSQKVYEQINAERQAGGIPPVLIEDSLSNLAKAKSLQLKVAPLAYGSLPPANSVASEDANTIPKMSRALSILAIEADPFDSWMNNNDQFRSDVLNPDFTSLGIGIESDGYNYYIVTVWQ